MKKNVIFLAIVALTHLFVLLIFLAACTEDERMSGGNRDIPEGDGIATVNMKLDAASMLGTNDLESTIHKVRILAFRTQDGVMKMNKLISFSSGYDADKDMILEEIETGLTDVFVIANETPDMTVVLDQTDGSVTIASVRTQLFAIEEVAGLLKEENLTNNGIPMYKEYSNLEFKISDTEHNPYILKVQLERILAKVTLTIRNQTHQEITLKSVVAKGLPQNSWLFPADYTGDTQDLDAIELPFNEVTKEYQPISFYLPEYLLTDVSKRSYLEIRGTATQVGMPDIDCSYKISLGNGLKNYGKEVEIEAAIDKQLLKASDLYIVRNTHYEISVSDIKGYDTDKITFFVGIIPWYNVSEGYFEGGTWVDQPVSQRIPLNESAKFTAKFTHSEAPYINYEWHRRRYLQTEADKEPAEPVDEIVYTEMLLNGETSIYNISATADPTASGEIYCKAAPVGGRHFRESNRATLMVIGDWEGGGDAFPEMQNWIPKNNSPLGASYLLRDTRDNKVYRTKLMADGNWWMIQDIAYKDPAKELTPISEFNDVALTSAGQVGIGALGNFYGTCCSSNEKTGGYLYTPAAAIAVQSGLIDNLPEETRNQENVIGVCPQGWHLPGNKDGEWNKEWTVLTENMVPVKAVTFSMFDYFDEKHFNAYTTTYVRMNDKGDDVEYKNEHTFRFHGGYTTVADDYFPLGIKVGFDSMIIPQQKAELYIFTNPTLFGDVPGGSSDDFVFTQSQQAGPIRCIRDYKYN